MLIFSKWVNSYRSTSLISFPGWIFKKWIFPPDLPIHSYEPIFPFLQQFCPTLWMCLSLEMPSENTISGAFECSWHWVFEMSFGAALPPPSTGDFNAMVWLSPSQKTSIITYSTEEISGALGPVNVFQKLITPLGPAAGTWAMSLGTQIVRWQHAHKDKQNINIIAHCPLSPRLAVIYLFWVRSNLHTVCDKWKSSCSEGLGWKTFVPAQFMVLWVCNIMFPLVYLVNFYNKKRSKKKKEGMPVL